MKLFAKFSLLISYWTRSKPGICYYTSGKSCPLAGKPHNSNRYGLQTLSGKSAV